MIATAPGKLLVTGEYAVLDGAPALLLAMNRRVVATREPRDVESPFLDAVAGELATRCGVDHPAAIAAREVRVDSRAFYERGRKLGLGSSAAVTVAATALALGPSADRDAIARIATAAHAVAQAPRGARGSGADIAAIVHGGAIAFTAGQVAPVRWPTSVMLLPFFTGQSADTASLVARVAAANRLRPGEVGRALAAIAEASGQMIAALDPGASDSVIAAVARAGLATDELATATRISLVPECVRAARQILERFGGTAKTTGAGGGDIALGVIPGTVDVTEAARALIEAGCQLLSLSLDETGVDLRPPA